MVKCLGCGKVCKAGRFVRHRGKTFCCDDCKSGKAKGMVCRFC